MITSEENRQYMIQRYENHRRNQHRRMDAPYQQQWAFWVWICGFRAFMQPKEERVTHALRKTQLAVHRRLP